MPCLREKCYNPGVELAGLLSLGDTYRLKAYIVVEVR